MSTTTPDPVADAIHGDDAPSHAAAHGPSVLLYVLIGLVLAGVTVFEVFLPAVLSNGVELRPTLRLVLPLLGLAFVKAGLVAAFYMHLRYDSRIYSIVMLLASLVVTYFLWLLTFSEAVRFQLFR